MKKFVISASALAFVAVLSSAPVRAEYNYGPVKNGDQCWKDASTRRSEFGAWDKCPSTAASPVAAVKHTRTHKRAHS